MATMMERVEPNDLRRYMKAQADVQQSRERFAAQKALLAAQLEAAEALTDFLRLKYRLQPQDVISEDGVITRARAKAPAVNAPEPAAPAPEPEATEG